MDEFKEYLRFPDLEISKEYTSVLERHNIPFVLDDISERFQLMSRNFNEMNSFILKIRDADLERVEELFDKEVDKAVKNLPPEHYLYSFADKDILDVIANQKNWSQSEIKLALKIANDRKIDLSAESINAAKKPMPELRAPRNPRLTIQNATTWFWGIAIFTILNSIFLRTKVDFHLPGLFSAEVLDGFLSYSFGSRIGFISCILISVMFFLTSRYGKHNKWVFLAGLIFYALDAILMILSFSSPRWTQILFISLAMWYMITGFANTVNDERKSAKLVSNA